MVDEAIFAKERRAQPSQYSRIIGDLIKY